MVGEVNGGWPGRGWWMVTRRKRPRADAPALPLPTTAVCRRWAGLRAALARRPANHLQHVHSGPRRHATAHAGLRRDSSHACEPHAVGRYSLGSPGTPRFFHAPVAGGLKQQLRVSPTPPRCSTPLSLRPRRALPVLARMAPARSPAATLGATTFSQARPPTPVVRHAPGLRSAPCSPRRRFSDLPADPRPHVHRQLKATFTDPRFE